LSRFIDQIGYRCKSHICWRCMGIFAADTIYNHMRNDHGTIHDDDPAEDRADVVPDWHHGLGLRQANILAERRLGQERFAVIQRMEEEALVARREAAARRDEIIRREEVARQDAARREAAVRRDDITRRVEAARRAARQTADATREEVRRRIAMQTYQTHLEEERERARAQEDQGGWGCTIM
jgi:hypothetical protein